MIQKQTKSNTDSGQAYTLESIAAVVILLSAVVFAQQITAITPLSASTSSQQVENQQGEQAKGLIESSASTGELKDTILTWDEDEGTYYETEDGLDTYRSNTPPTQFGDIVERDFVSQSIGVNIEFIYYEESGGDLSRQRLSYLTYGSPSDNSFSTRVAVPLYDDDEILDENGDPTGVTLADSNTFPIENIDSSSETYNTVIVQITIWRI